MNILNYCIVSSTQKTLYCRSVCRYAHIFTCLQVNMEWQPCWTKCLATMPCIKQAHFITIKSCFSHVSVMLHPVFDFVTVSFDKLNNSDIYSLGSVPWDSILNIVMITRRRQTMSAYTWWKFTSQMMVCWVTGLIIFSFWTKILICVAFLLLLFHFVFSEYQCLHWGSSAELLQKTCIWTRKFGHRF